MRYYCGNKRVGNSTTSVYLYVSKDATDAMKACHDILNLVGFNFYSMT